MIKIKSNKIITLISIFVLVSIVSGFLFYNVCANSKTNEEELYDNLEPFFEALNLVRSEYIKKDIDLDKVVQGAIKGMLKALDDPYTRFMDPQSLKREQEDMFLGRFGGLGIIISMKDDQLIIISPIEDTPAYKAGVKAGDKIVEIDGKSTEGMGVDEAVDILRGEKGTEVILGIKRENVEEILEISIIRDIIEVKAVKKEVMGKNNNLGYVRITTFNVNTKPELEEVLNEFKKDSDIHGIILDLRNNPGGLLDSAIEVASKFIKEGPIVHIKDRDGIVATIESRGNEYPEWPLFVLVNEGSASASEIVAGAIQDTGRGKLLGEKTFGKGVVQQVFNLYDGSGIAITTSEYFTPNERSINHIGIEPDILVEPAAEDDEQDIQLNKAIQLLEEELN
ncbi:MAG: S41 family peptidase [Candidatus Atribacteria bacterium]|nr:S41 family peptidase [Candidatus Atribacteria bacterium]MBE3092639.1 S41 family peptidase [Chloroflexota bacterium]MBE3127684.1 S41 family peptidase [Candidatus Atribacteria bacterium]